MKMGLTAFHSLPLFVQIPIYRGAEAPLVFPFKFKEQPPYHGYDGFGDAEFPKIVPKLEKENGISAIIRLAHQYKSTGSIFQLIQCF